jgi:hypothetical protein
MKPPGDLRAARFARGFSQASIGQTIQNEVEGI